jgi:hypothetical protein
MKLIRNSNAAWLLMPVILAAPSFLPQSTLGASSAVWAQDGATSALSGIKLSQSPTALDDEAFTSGFGQLLGALAKDIKLESEAVPAEVWIWKGGNFKANRAAFTKSAVHNALKAAGYVVEEISVDELRDVNPFVEDYNLKTAPVEVSITDRFGYLKAVNTDKSQTLLGAWIQGEERLVLALSPAKFVAPKKVVPLPAVTGTNMLLVKDPYDAMKGIAQPKAPVFPKLARKPGFISGMAKSADGKALANAQIIVQSSAAGGFRTSVRTRTNAQGLYEIAVPVGICQVVNADWRTTYNGQSYLLPLHPVDGEREYFNSKTGAVENLILRTYGVADPSAANSPQYGSYYYGGHIRLQWFGSDIPEGGTFQITLKPQGPLLGGGTARTLVFRIPNKEAGERFLNDIPLGRYTIDVKLFDDGETLPVRIQELWSKQEPSETLTVNFKGKTGELVSLNSSGVERFEVILKP